MSLLHTEEMAWGGSGLRQMECLGWGKWGIDFARVDYRLGAMLMRGIFLMMVLLLAGCGREKDGRLIIAVAANFLATAEALVEASGLEADVIAGSTGGLVGQVLQGAPYDVFLGADEAGAARLGEDDFTYAVGRLVLWGREEVSDGSLDGEFRWLAMADPEVAPYGVAARQVLERRNLWHKLEGRRVMGASVGQAMEMAVSGNADYAFTSLSLAMVRRGQWWEVPEDEYAPLVQGGIILEDSEMSRAFVRFLLSREGRDLISQRGYGLP